MIRQGADYAPAASESGAVVRFTRHLKAPPTAVRSRRELWRLTAVLF